MEYRTLGRTGVKVSPLCLGAMMFGAWGNPDHDDSVKIIHAALDAGINFVDTADVYSRRRVRGDRRARHSSAGATTSCSPRRCTRAMGDDPNMTGNSRRWIIRECEESLRRLGTDYIDLYQIHRPDPSCDIDDTLERALRSRAPGQGPLHRELDVPRVGDRRGAVDGRAAQPRALRVRAAAVFDPRARHRGRRAADVRPLRHGRHPVEPARRRMALRASGARARIRRAVAPRASPTATTSRSRGTSASSRPPTRSRRSPRTRASRSCTSRSRGCINHPAVTSAIIGPRTMEQLTTQLGAADVTLDAGHARPHRRDRPARDELHAGSTPATSRRAWRTPAAPPTPAARRLSSAKRRAAAGGRPAPRPPALTRRSPRRRYRIPGS